MYEPENTIIPIADWVEKCREISLLKKQNKFMQEQILNVAQLLDKLALLIDEHSKIQGELNASQKEG